VAGFMGSPAMNLFPAHVDPHGDLLLGGATVGVAAGAARTAGVRPEAIGLGAPGDGGVAATVEHRESLGHETLAPRRADGGGPAPVRLVARVDGMPGLSRGDAVGLRIDPARVYLFGPDGAALR